MRSASTQIMMKMVSSQSCQSQVARYCVIGVLALAAAILSGTRLLAHDMWIEPSTYSPGTGQMVSVRFKVGQDFLGDPIPRTSTLVNQFVVDDGEGRKPVVGREGGDPAGYLRVAAPGLLIVGYRSNPSSVELTAEKFSQ